MHCAAAPRGMSTGAERLLQTLHGSPDVARIFLFAVGAVSGTGSSRARVGVIRVTAREIRHEIKIAVPAADRAPG